MRINQSAIIITDLNVRNSDTIREEQRIQECKASLKNTNTSQINLT